MTDPEAIEIHFSKLTAPLYLEHLLDTVGALIVGQTEHRIHTEKTSPVGAPWPEWSAKYAARVEASGNEHHTMLEAHGDLLTSLTSAVHAGLGESEVEVGSNLVYAATHQYGRDSIPQRRYLGLSADNTHALDKLVTDYLGTLL
jgi:phage gpG-like protein